MNIPQSFNPSRLDLARRRRGLTKQALAEAVNISPRSLVGYYGQEREPSPETLSAFAATLDFPIDFFYGDDLEEPSLEGASFRALSRMTARLRNQAIAAGALGICLSDWIDERFNLPEVKIPRYDIVDPATAAIELRNEWGLGEKPVRNVIHLLELYGGRVFSLSEDTAVLDAYSFWRGATPYVFLNTMKTAERSRMDAAHELGHLILHWKGSRDNKQAELEAQIFGSTFLMPRGSVVSRIRPGATLAQIIKAKRYWGVSVVALTYRLHKVGLLTDFQYRRLFAQIGRHNYRVEEPNPAPRERSQVLAKVFEALAQKKMWQPEVARMLSLHPSEVTSLLFGLVQGPMVIK